MLKTHVKFGLSPIILYKEQMFAGPEGEISALAKASKLKNYEVLETFLSDNPVLRKEELKMIWGEGKAISYNARALYQVPGKYNIASLDDKEFQGGVDLLKQQIDLCAEAESKKILITSGPDYLPERRSETKKRLAECFAILSSYARERDITICLEPTERHRFKHQLLGPTTECIQFIDNLHKEYGCENVTLMIDTAHCPLMEEDVIEDVKLIAAQNLGYVHVGDAVLDPNSAFWGHTHPPVSVMGGGVGLEEFTLLLKTLFEVGYLKKDVSYAERPWVSYEMSKYIGVSEETSAQFAYEIAESAFEKALSLWCSDTARGGV